MLAMMTDSQGLKHAYWIIQISALTLSVPGLLAFPGKKYTFDAHYLSFANISHSFELMSISRDPLVRSHMKWTSASWLDYSIAGEITYNN